MHEFNFDEWADLYKNNPEEFERRRREVLDAEILKAPVENRAQLRLIQMKCDAAHEGMSPLQATAEISNMMMHKLNQLKAPLTQLRSIIEDSDDK